MFVGICMCALLFVLVCVRVCVCVRARVCLAKKDTNR
jgi:hypothetical protein